MEKVVHAGLSPKKLREFGFTLGTVFGAWGLWRLWRGTPYGPIALGISVFFLFFGAFFSEVLRPIEKAWMKLAEMIGAVMSRVVLCVLFYVVFTPIRLILTILGKDLMDRKWGEKKDTFWISRDITKTKESYERQF